MRCRPCFAGCILICPAQPSASGRLDRLSVPNSYASFFVVFSAYHMHGVGTIDCWFTVRNFLDWLQLFPSKRSAYSWRIFITRLKTRNSSEFQPDEEGRPSSVFENFVFKKRVLLGAQPVAISFFSCRQRLNNLYRPFLSKFHQQQPYGIIKLYPVQNAEMDPSSIPTGVFPVNFSLRGFRQFVINTFKLPVCHSEHYGKGTGFGKNIADIPAFFTVFHAPAILFSIGKSD